jgi:FAD/FMN-containing dehydrogenase
MTSLRFLRLPALPELPEVLRGRQVVVLDGALLGDDALGAELFAGFRELGPELDTFARVPAPTLARLHMDPEDPTPAVGGGFVLGALGDDTIDAMLAVAGPGADCALLAAELRQLGGALGRRHPAGGVLDHVPGTHVAFMVAVAATPEMTAAGAASIAAMTDALAPWANGRSYLNFVEGPADAGTAFDEDAYARLRQIRAEVDPHGLFLANHTVAAPDA